MSIHPRVRSAAFLVVIGMAAGASVVAIATAEDDAACVPAAARIDPVVARLDAIEAATARAKGDAAWAKYAAHRMRGELDAYAAQWRAAWLDACAPGETAGELRRADTADVQRQCLDERLVTADVVSTELEAGVDPARAMAVAEGLPRIADCADPAHLSSRVPWPGDSTARGAIEIVRRQLIATQFEPDPLEAAIATSDLVDDAADLDYAPLHIEALRMFGQRQLEANKLAAGLHNLEQSLLLAREHADHAAAIEALLILARHDGRAAARRWLAEAETLLPGVPARGAREAELRLLQGQLHAAAGQSDAARTALERARALFAEHAPNALESIAQTHLLLADLTEGDASRRHREQARAAWLTRLGPDHPRLQPGE